MTRGNGIVLGFVSGAIVVALYVALLFGSAGRWDLPMFWTYVGVWAVTCVVGPLVMGPDLVAERLLPGPGGRDYGFTIAFVPLLLGQLVVAGLDVGRFHWSDTVSPAVQVIGLAAMAIALATMLWATSVNRFFSSVIRIQTERGHRVITAGPYRFVRHPAYAVTPLLFVGGGLALGSWLATLIGLLLFVAVIRRTADEDRILRAELEGYDRYAERVRYRLFPGVW